MKNILVMMLCSSVVLVSDVDAFSMKLARTSSSQTQSGQTVSSAIQVKATSGLLQGEKCLIPRWIRDNMETRQTFTCTIQQVKAHPYELGQTDPILTTTLRINPSFHKNFDTFNILSMIGSQESRVFDFSIIDLSGRSWGNNSIQLKPQYVFCPDNLWNDSQWLSNPGNSLYSDVTVLTRIVRKAGTVENITKHPSTQVSLHPINGELAVSPNALDIGQINWGDAVLYRVTYGAGNVNMQGQTKTGMILFVSDISRAVVQQNDDDSYTLNTEQVLLGTWPDKFR
ncbi:MAG: hypothetical protein E7015_01790 [Alphaproteobacteria bacterium]|nr:hypothetical protein [Alphaproteobacteria bacterium]